MTIETIDLEVKNGCAEDELEITIRGKSAQVIEALIRGLPAEGLLELHEALEAELAKRRAVATDSAGS